MQVDVPATVPIPSGFAPAASTYHVKASDRKQAPETFLIRVPKGTDLALLQGLELDMDLAPGTVVALAGNGDNTEVANGANGSKKSKKSAAKRAATASAAGAGGLTLVLGTDAVPETANLSVLIGKGAANEFTPMPIIHAAALVQPVVIPAATIAAQGEARLHTPYEPRAQPDMPYRPAFDAFAGTASILLQTAAVPVVTDSHQQQRKKKRSASDALGAAAASSSAVHHHHHHHHHHHGEDAEEAIEAEPARKRAKTEATSSDADAASATPDAAGNKRKAKKDKKSKKSRAE
ncbi:hypothetical protein BC828DRAFT_438819 [Blastocladiella britannica]|nr:hypothetical protein BC828DRAFT_438819 [Blastocladiella britannica]